MHRTTVSWVGKLLPEMQLTPINNGKLKHTLVSAKLGFLFNIRVRSDHASSRLLNPPFSLAVDRYNIHHIPDNEKQSYLSQGI